MTKKHIGVLSDTHCGSVFGLWPRDYILPGGGKYRLNVGQEYLLDMFDSIVHRLPWLDALLLNGDLIDGRNKRQKGWGQVTVDLSAQRGAVIEVTRELRAKSGIVIETSGTRYHETREGMEELARQLGALPNNKGMHCRPIARFNVDGVYIDARHRLSGAWMYKASAMQRANMFDSMAARHKGYFADLLIGSHWHQFAHWIMDDYEVVTTPSLEMLNPYAEELNPDLWFPSSLGVILITVDGEAKKRGRKFIEVEKFTFPHPDVREDFIEL